MSARTPCMSTLLAVMHMIKVSGMQAQLTIRDSFRPGSTKWWSKYIFAFMSVHASVC